MKRITLTMGLLLFAFTQAKAIEYGLMKNEFGADGGSVEGVSDSDFQDVLEGASIVGAHYMYFVHPRFGIGMQADVISFDDKNQSLYSYMSDGLGGSITTWGQTTSKYEDISLMMVGRFNLLTKGLGIPFLTAGIGGNRFKAESASSLSTYYYNSGFGINSSSFGSDETADSSTGLSYSLGAGLDMMISEVCRIGVEWRYNVYNQSVYEDLDALEFTTLKGRLSWYF